MARGCKILILHARNIEYMSAIDGVDCIMHAVFNQVFDRP